jgi:hypothetical protein
MSARLSVLPILGVAVHTPVTIAAETSDVQGATSAPKARLLRTLGLKPLPKNYLLIDNRLYVEMHSLNL